MPESTINYKDELVIREGQVFNREIFESPLGDIEKLLEAACIPTSNHITPLAFPSLLRHEWCKGHWFGISPKKDLLVFTEIEYIPFPQAYGTYNGGDLYVLEFNRPEATSPIWEHKTSEDKPQHIKLEGCPKWYPPHGGRFFIATHYGTSDTSVVYPPFLFMLLENSVEPIIPNLPNVFDTGKICTGHSYNHAVRGKADTFDKIRSALDTIRTAPANSDLRNCDKSFIQWKLNDEGEAQQVAIPWSKSNGYEATDSRILDFTRFIKGL